VVHAQVEFWEYQEPIRTSADQKCISTWASSISMIDLIISLKRPYLTRRLQAYFGLPNVTHVHDFANVLDYPLGHWQARNWDDDASSKGWDVFCEALVGLPQESGAEEHFEELRELGLGKAVWTGLAGYAEYIRGVASLCDTPVQDECFGTFDPEPFGESDLSQTWRAWQWQVRPKSFLGRISSFRGN
jgi:hypothetical protein